jgi:plastocyanin
MRIHALVPALALTALTACGGGGGTGTDAGDSPSTTAPAPTTAAPSTPAAAETPPVALAGKVNDRGTRDAGGGTVAMDLGDFFFAPTFVKGVPGGKLTVNLKNTGQAPHTFTIDSPKIDVMVAVGGTGAATVTLPKSGTIAFYCTLHKAQGMQGGIFLAT